MIVLLVILFLRTFSDSIKSNLFLPNLSYYWILLYTSRRPHYNRVVYKIYKYGEDISLFRLSYIRKFGSNCSFQWQCSDQIFKISTERVPQTLSLSSNVLLLDTAIPTDFDWLWRFALNDWLLRLILTYVHAHTLYLIRSQTHWHSMSYLRSGMFLNIQSKWGIIIL